MKNMIRWLFAIGFNFFLNIQIQFIKNKEKFGVQRILDSENKQKDKVQKKYSVKFKSTMAEHRLKHFEKLGSNLQKKLNSKRNIFIEEINHQLPNKIKEMVKKNEIKRLSKLHNLLALNNFRFAEGEIIKLMEIKIKNTYNT